MASARGRQGRTVTFESVGTERCLNTHSERPHALNYAPNVDDEDDRLATLPRAAAIYVNAKSAGHFINVGIGALVRGAASIGYEAVAVYRDNEDSAVVQQAGQRAVLAAAQEFGLVVIWDSTERQASSALLGDRLDMFQYAICVDGQPGFGDFPGVQISTTTYLSGVRQYRELSD